MKIFHVSKLRTSQSHEIYIYIYIRTHIYKLNFWSLGATKFLLKRKKYERVIKSNATLLPLYKIIIIKLMQFSFLIYFANYN